MSNTLVDEFAEVTSTVLEPLTVQQYHAMIEQGILPEGAPIELIDGLLVRRDRRDKGGSIMTVGPRHALVLGELADRLRDLLRGAGAHIRDQLPITLGELQEPEPDVAVVLGNRRDYRGHHPGPGAIPLVVEVADSSLALDRREKLPRYAAAGIATYWIVNLSEEIIEVYTRPQPQEARYEHRTEFRPGETISFEIVGMTIDIGVDDILV